MHPVVGTYPLGKRPRGIVASPDGKRLYVALSGSPLGGPGVDESTLPPADKAADGIGVLDAATGKLLRTLTGVSDPEQLAVSGDGSRLYVASEDTGRAVVLRTADSQVDSSVDVGGEPEGVAASERAGLVGITSESGSTVTLLDIRSARVVATLAAGQRPRDLVFNQEGTRLYVSGENDASVTVIDVPARKVLKSVHLAGEMVRPKGLALSPDGRRLYVTTGRGRHVLALDAGTLGVLGSAAVGQRPWGVAVSPDGRFLFTANGPSNDISVVDTGDMHVVATLAAGNRPWGVAVVATTLPSTAPAYRITRAVNLGAPDRWDYVTYDEATHDVFVAHGDRVTVVDGRDGRIVGNVEGMAGGTHGVAISAGSGKVYTDDGGEGMVVAFDLATLKATRRVDAGKDADGMLLEPATGLLYVVNAEPGHLTVIDPKTEAVVTTIDAGAALEFLVADGAGKVYVNGEANGEIVRVDAPHRRPLADARLQQPARARHRPREPSPVFELRERRAGGRGRHQRRGRCEPADRAGQRCGGLRSEARARLQLQWPRWHDHGDRAARCAHLRRGGHDRDGGHGQDDGHRPRQRQAVCRRCGRGHQRRAGAGQANADRAGLAQAPVHRPRGLMPAAPGARYRTVRKPSILARPDSGAPSTMKTQGP